jgi:hypothetical protein
LLPLPQQQQRAQQRPPEQERRLHVSLGVWFACGVVVWWWWGDVMVSAAASRIGNANVASMARFLHQNSARAGFTSTSGEARLRLSAVPE